MFTCMLPSVERKIFNIWYNIKQHEEVPILWQDTVAFKFVSGFCYNNLNLGYHAHVDDSYIGLCDCCIFK